MTTQDRLDTLPNEIWDCERCDSNNSMQLRRSSLNDEFMADDVGLKCENCYYYATHGIPFHNPDKYNAERENRDGRVRDYAQESIINTDPLEALGYLAKAKDETTE